MWIMLNNKPFDLSKMVGVSVVVEISTDYIRRLASQDYLTGQTQRRFILDIFKTKEKIDEVYGCLRNNVDRDVRVLF